MALNGDERKLTVLLPGPESWTPFPPAPMRMNPGVILVVLDGEIETSGMFDLPPEVGGHIAPNTGTVVAAGPDQPDSIGTCPPVSMEVAVGDRVIVLPFEGVRWRVLHFPGHDWAARNVVMLGGVVGDLPLSHSNGRRIDGASDVYDHEPYHLPCVAKLLMPEEKISIQPIGDWILIRRDPLQEKKGGFIMTESTRGVNSLGRWKATIVAASAKAQEFGYSAGSRCIYHAPGSLVAIDGVHARNFDLDGPVEDYAFIRFTQCYGAILAAPGVQFVDGDELTDAEAEAAGGHQATVAWDMGVDEGSRTACISCGGDLDDGWLFCSSCGERGQ